MIYKEEEKNNIVTIMLVQAITNLVLDSLQPLRNERNVRIGGRGAGRGADELVRTALTRIRLPCG